MFLLLYIRHMNLMMFYFLLFEKQLFLRFLFGNTLFNEFLLGCLFNNLFPLLLFPLILGRSFLFLDGQLFLNFILQLNFFPGMLLQTLFLKVLEMYFLLYQLLPPLQIVSLTDLRFLGLKPHIINLILYGLLTLITKHLLHLLSFLIIVNRF